MRCNDVEITSIRRYYVASTSVRRHLTSYARLLQVVHEKMEGENLIGWSGGAMALGKLPVPGRPTIWMKVGQGPTALAVGAGGGCLDIFTLVYPFSPLSPFLWETARYRLKYCLKVPLNPNQPTNQPTNQLLPNFFMMPSLCYITNS